MLEKLLFGFMGFIISFFVILGVTHELLWSLLSSPTTYNDDMEGLAVAKQIGLWPFFVALIGSSLIAWLAARYSVRLSRSHPPESFRRGPSPPL